MFKVIIPILCSVFCGDLGSVLVSWLVMSGVFIFHPEFMMSIFLFEGVSKAMICLTLWVSAMMLVVSVGVFEKSMDTWLLACISFLTLFLVLTFVSSRFAHFYFFFEATLFPTLFLIYGWGGQPERVQAAFYLLVYTVLGSLPFLYVLGVLKDSFGDDLFLVSVDRVYTEGYLWWGIMLVFFVKLPMYPFHLWLPKAHVEAPLAGSMALAGVLLKLGVFGIMLFSKKLTLPPLLTSCVLALCLWGGVVTSIICVRQVDMKSLIAYSSIGHMGLVLAGLLSESELGVKGAVIMAVAHGFSSPALFNFASGVYDVVHSRSLLLCKGAVSLFPPACLFLFLACAANMSAPPLINLVGEVWLTVGVTAFSSWSIIPLIFMCFLVGCYSLYLYTALSHGSPCGFVNPMESYSSVNYYSMLMQVSPLVWFILNMGLFI